MIKVIHHQENKLLDREGCSRRKKLRIYNVPEGDEGSSMEKFVEKLLRDTLEIPTTMELDIERAHRSIAPRCTKDTEEKPRSILIRFLSYRTKAEILRKAWGRRGVSLNGRQIYFDQDYPPAVLVPGGGGSDYGHEGKSMVTRRETLLSQLSHLGWETMDRPRLRGSEEEREKKRRISERGC